MAFTSARVIFNGFEIFKDSTPAMRSIFSSFARPRSGELGGLSKWAGVGATPASGSGVNTILGPRAGPRAEGQPRCAPSWGHGRS
jgi:hypothetical protein